MSVNAESLIELTGIKELLKNSYSTIMSNYHIFWNIFFVNLKVRDRFVSSEINSDLEL